MLFLLLELNSFFILQDVSTGARLTFDRLKSIHSKSPVLGRFLQQYVFRYCNAATCDLLQAIVAKSQAAHQAARSQEASISMLSLRAGDMLMLMSCNTVGTNAFFCANDSE